jgi:hypothetical protein
VSATDPEPPSDLLTFVEKLCEERGATIGVSPRVSPAYYHWFITMNDQAMTELLHLLVLERRDDINRMAFEKRCKESDLYTMVHTWLRLVARGYLQFSAGGDLLFYKPVGPEPTAAEWHKIEARVESSNTLIRSTIINLLQEKGKDE